MNQLLDDLKATSFYKKLLKAKETRIYYGCVKSANANDEITELLTILTSFLDDAYETVYTAQRFYHILEEDFTLQKCKCGKLLNFGSINKGGYFRSCNNSSCKKEIEHSTCMKRYGIKSPMQSKEFKKRWEDKNIATYGVKYPLQNEDIQSKRNTTRREKLVKKIKLNIDTDGNGVFKEINKNIVSYECFTCNNISLLNFHNLNRHNLCIHCYPLNTTSSSYEVEIHNFLNEHNIEFEIRNKTILKPQEIDIYIPFINLAIEFNGVYWHSDIHKDNKYHYRKYIDCKNVDVNLIQIWEDSWNNKKDIFKSIILHKCGKSEKIYGRKTQVREISFTEANDFCEINHLHGYVKSTYKVGLFYNNELVSVITFGNRKISGGGSKIELLRYCSKKGITIIGGFSKLFNFAISTFNFSEVLTFSYNDLGINGIYENNGFKETNKTFGYFYCNGYERFNRINFQKHKLIEKYGKEACLNKSEKEIMKEKGYLICYDSGSTSWIWTK